MGFRGGNRIRSRTRTGPLARYGSRELGVGSSGKSTEGRQNVQRLPYRAYNGLRGLRQGTPLV